MRSRRSAVGQRFRPGRPRSRRCRCRRGEGSQRRARSCVVLPAVPVMPMLGPPQRSSKRSPRHESARSASTERPTRGATSGVQTSRYAISASPGSASRSTLGWTSIPSSRSSPRLGGLGLRAREPHRVALRRRAVGRAQPRRRRTPRSGHPHLDHRGSTSFSRTKARMTSSRSAAAVELQEVVERLTGEVTTRCGSKPRRRAEAAPLPILGSLDEAMPRPRS